MDLSRLLQYDVSNETTWPVWQYLDQDFNVQRLHYMIRHTELFVSNFFQFVVFPSSIDHHIKILHKMKCVGCNETTHLDQRPFVIINGDRFYEFQKFSLTKSLAKVTDKEKYVQNFDLDDPQFYETINKSNIYTLDWRFHLFVPQDVDLKRDWNRTDWSKAVFLDSRRRLAYRNDSEKFYTFEISEYSDWLSFVWHHYFS